MQGFSRKILNDRHKYLIAMLQGVQNGYNLPESITPEEYRYIRDHKDEDPALAGFVGFGCSFGGKWFGGYARNASGTNYALQSKRSLLKDMATLQDAHFVCEDYPASPAVYRAEFNIEVPVGTRFSCEDLNFVVTARMDPEEDTETGLSHQVTCETPGAAANNYGGTLIPVEYVQGLTHAELVELLIPGDDEEETEAFRQRVLDSFQSQAFGGNQADYREKVLAMPGVGDLKIHPVWNGDISPASLIPDEAVESWYTSTISTVSGSVATWLTAVYTAAKEKKLTVGGTVKLVIMASDYKAPTPTLLEEIQTAIDPEQNAGEGLGLAPIGHVVHVTGVTPEEVDIALHLTYASGWDWDAVKSYVEAVIDAYFVELSQDWASSDFLTVRISQIESRILSECSNMITDIGGTKINGQENNLALGPDSIPARGEVTDG